MIYKREGSKYLYMDLMVNGKRINRSTKVTTMALARKVEEHVRTQAVIDQITPKEPGISLSEAVDLTWESRWYNKPSGDQAVVRMEFIEQIVASNVASNVANIDRKVLRKLRKKLEPGRSPATVNRYMANLKTVLNECRKEGIISSVPEFDMFDEPKTRDILNTVTDEQEALLLDKASPLMHDLVTICLDTGMRIGEVLALRPEMVKDDHIVLPSSVTKTKTGRMVPFSEKTADIIKERARDNNLVFMGPSGKALKSNNISKMFRELKEACGITADITMHCLRHTYASRMVTAGMPMRALQIILGHSSIKTTERYAHLDASDALEYYKKADINA